MSDLKKKLDVAKLDYAAAQLALNVARSHYNNGPQKEYAEIKANIAALKAKTDEHEATLAAARSSLAGELRATNGITTEAAWSFLHARRNSEEVITEYGLILCELEKQERELRLIISKAATDYRFAYARATECWALVNTYTVLVDCGEQLCKAMAVQPWEGIENNSSLAGNVIRTEIAVLLKNYQGETQPYLSELGPCDFGVLSLEEIMSPAEMHKAKFQTQ